MIYELVTFELSDPAAVDDFLAADERVQQEWAPFQPGFVRRTTTREVDGTTWLVETIWGDVEVVDAAVSDAAGAPAVQALHAFIDAPSATRRVFQTREWLVTAERG